MAQVDVTVWDLLEEAGRLFRANVAMSISVFLAIAGASAVSWTIIPNNFGGVLVWAALLLGQFQLTKASLASFTVGTGGTERFWPMMGLCILSELGLVIGFGLLIVPGLVLWARWLLSGPILMAEGVGIIEALQRSWRETSANSWLLVQAFAFVYGPFILLVAVESFFDSSPTDPSALGVMANLAAYAGAVASWLVAVAAYKMSGRSRAIAKTFD
jgi:hypothetical protein